MVLVLIGGWEASQGGMTEQSMLLLGVGTVWILFAVARMLFTE